MHNSSSTEAQRASSLADTSANSDARQRFAHFTVFISLGLPTMLAFGIYHLWLGSYLLFATILASGLGLGYGWLRVRKDHQSKIIYRFNGLIYLGLMLYLLALGGEGGSKILWMYTVPMIGIFLLGRFEGLFWSLAALLLGLWLTLATPAGISIYDYSEGFLLRFALTYLIVTVVSFYFEHLRRTYLKKMELEQKKLQAEQARLNDLIASRTLAEEEKEESIRHLQQALVEVEKLRGLLPMCASCRKIRNDSGFWKDIETYLEDHSEVQFTHGLCPTCVTELYPFMNEAGKNTENSD